MALNRVHRNRRTRASAAGEQQPPETANDNEEEVDKNAPVRYAPLRDLYSATSPCMAAGGSSSSKAGPRKVCPPLPPLVHVYSRRCHSRTRHSSPPKPSFFDSLVSRVGHKSPDPSALVAVKEEPVEEMDEGEAEPHEEEESEAERKKRKRKELRKKWLRPIKREPASLDRDTTELRVQNGNKGYYAKNMGRKRKRQAHENGAKADENGTVDPAAKKWVRLSFDGVEPEKFIGLQCKVYWPLDDDWYGGLIVGYNAETGRHQVSYEDGDKENVILSIEKIKFHISPDEMQRLNLKYSTAAIADGLNFSEMVVLAAGFDDDHDLGPGDIIWAKLAGHAVWPAVIVDDSVLGSRKGLNRASEGKSVPVQFFGTHDFARVNVKQVISFLKGLLSSFHLKCKKPNFMQSLEEAKMYLSEQHLPEKMLRMQNGEETDNCDFSGQEDEENVNSSEDCIVSKEVRRKVDGLKTCPFEIGDLRVISLGNIVKDSKFFQDGTFIWPAGYTAVRKFSSIADPSTHAFYKMEVLRDVDSRLRPLFKVTVDGRQFKGSTPTACWNKIYERIRKTRKNCDGLTNEGGHCNKRFSDSGSEMFGFSYPEVMKLIKKLSNSKHSLKSSQELPIGYRPVDVKWKDLDKCSVCHMDEEYENNLFLQCDKCRMMVHAKCYGELEPVDGVLWLCNLCRPGAPEYSPPCCLCPVRGGAMKPTTDGRWAHLACAIWIPETCLSDIKKMEPIDGLGRVSKDRWKLLCSICGVSYGACIQCSNNTCRVAFHPLCARVAGFCIELADEDKLHLINMDEDEEHQCIQLLSFCKKHRPPSRERLKAENRIVPVTRQVPGNVPPLNPSGCARSEPFNFLGRRGRKEPEALAASSLKRLFVENKPYLVHGFCRHGASFDVLSSAAFSGYNSSSSSRKPMAPLLDVPNSIHSMVEKFRYMRTTFRKRLAFGKSGIHGFGIFAKQPHRAGDMVIEYTGELVRPAIADRREHLIYNSLVGAGTYIFRIDNERVIDATRAGSIAHLINHSCEPNCYSRVITVNGDEHIIIFAKRDIKQWEELTYDYRFMSIDEQLPCYCGHIRCRGVVNDIEAEELVGKLLVPCSDLTELSEE